MIGTGLIRRRVPVVLVGMVLALCAWAGLARAADYTVNDTNDAPLATDTSGCTSTDGPGQCTLRAAVQAADEAALASDGQGASTTITLPAGNYALTITGGSDDSSSGSLDILNGADVTITGAGSGTTTVDATNLRDRAFYVDSGNALSLSGVTIKGGSAESGSGGAIYNDGALAITGDVTFTSNHAITIDGGGDGGAIYSDSDTTALSIDGATFVRNSAEGLGGAIYDASPAAAKITHSVFTANTSDGLDNDVSQGEQRGQPDGAGGAIFGANGGDSGIGNITIDQSSFSDNSSADGSAIFWDGASNVTVTNSSFTGNASAGGQNFQESGGVYTQASTVGGTVADVASQSMTLTGDRFAGNSAPEGGALVLDSGFSDGTSAAYTLGNDEFDNNTATGEGGAVLWQQGSLTTTDSTLTGNTAGLGGALAMEDSSNDPLSLINTTISDNTAQQGGGIYFGYEEQPATLTNDTIAFNSAESGEGGGIYGASDVVANSDVGAAGVQNTIVGDNQGGDCDSTFDETADAGYNLDSDGSCFGELNDSDQAGVNPLLAHAADNGGPVLTDAELAGSPAIMGAHDDACPATDARGVARPQGTCDIGAFQSTPTAMALTNTAPSNATQNSAFAETITASNGGGSLSTGTTVADQIPSGETVWSVSSSQGSCAISASGSQVTCSLGNVASGSAATITLVVSESAVGSASNTATLTNDQGDNQQATAVTHVASNTVVQTVTVPGTTTTVPAPAGSQTVTTKAIGRLLLDSTKLTVRRGKISVPFTCASAQECRGTFSIVVRLKSARTGAIATAVCSNSATSRFRIPGNGKATINSGFSQACVALLRTKHHQSMSGKLSSGPRSGQGGVIEKVKLTLRK